MHFDMYGFFVEVFVADKTHSVDMVVKFVIVGPLAVECDRRSHLEKTVSQKFEPLVVLTHASLNMSLLLSVFLCVIRVFGKGFEGKVQLQVEIQVPTGLPSNQIGLCSADDGWER